MYTRNCLTACEWRKPRPPLLNRAGFAGSSRCSSAFHLEAALHQAPYHLQGVVAAQISAFELLRSSGWIVRVDLRNSRDVARDRNFFCLVEVDLHECRPVFIDRGNLL